MLMTERQIALMRSVPAEEGDTEVWYWSFTDFMAETGTGIQTFFSPPFLTRDEAIAWFDRQSRVEQEVMKDGRA